MTKYKAYYKSQKQIQSLDSSIPITCDQDTISNNLDKFYHVKDSNGKYDYSKVTSNIVVNKDDINLLHPNLLFSYPYGNFTSTSGTIITEIDLDKEYNLSIQDLVKELNTVNNYLLKKKDISLNSKFYNNWYDFFTINDYNISNNYYIESDSSIYDYCELGKIPLSSDPLKSVNRNLYSNKKFNNTFFYSPLAIILLFGSNEDDLIDLYKKHIQSKWDQEKSTYTPSDINKIKYDLNIDNIDSYIRKYTNRIFVDDICKNINNLYKYYNEKSKSLNHTHIEPLYDKYLNNIYDINIDIFYYDKAYEIATKVLEYNNSKDQNSIFYRNIKSKIIQISETDDIENYINILTMACYYCFGNINENKNNILNKIIINYNNICFNKLNSETDNLKSNLNFDISNLNIDVNKKLFDDIKVFTRTYSETTTGEYNIRKDNCGFIDNKINKINNNNKLNINLFKNSFLSTLIFYINFFIYITITIMIIYLSYYLIINNWNSFKNVFDTLIFGLIILISSIIDYLTFFAWKIPKTKRRVLHVNKLSLDLELEINLLKRKYAIINSKLNTDNILQNIILGIAFICISIIIFKTLIYIINDFSKIFNKNKENISNNIASCKNIGDDINIMYKLYTLNNNNWYHFLHHHDKTESDEKYISEIRQVLLYLQLNKIEKNVFKESDFKLKLIKKPDIIFNNVPLSVDFDLSSINYKIQFNIDLNTLSRRNIITLKFIENDGSNLKGARFENFNDDENKKKLENILKIFRFGLDNKLNIIDYNNFNECNIMKYDDKKNFAKYLENILFIININYRHYNMFYKLSQKESKEAKKIEDELLKIEKLDISDSEKTEKLTAIRNKFKPNISKELKWSFEEKLESIDNKCSKDVLNNNIIFTYNSDEYTLKLTNIELMNNEKGEEKEKDRRNLDYCYN